MPKKSTSGSRLDASCEGGGSGGSGIEIIERSTSGSHLDMREVVVVADVLKRQRGPPPARARMRGRVEAMEGGSNGGWKQWKRH
jgi:hypothetical protein